MKEVDVPLKTTVAVTSEYGAPSGTLPVVQESKVGVPVMELAVLVVLRIVEEGTPVPRGTELSVLLLGVEEVATPVPSIELVLSLLEIVEVVGTSVPRMTELVLV